MSTSIGEAGLGQKATLAFGAIYTPVGLAGFAITGFDDFFAKTDEKLLIFEINGFHNVVHILIGVAGLLMWRRPATARLFGWLLFVGYGATFVYGLFVANQADGNFLSLNTADNGLHLASALAGLGIALVTSRRGNVLDSSGRSVRAGSSTGR